MELNLITDVNNKPTMEQIFAFMGDSTTELWTNITDFLKENYNPKEEFFYSKCSSKPGWNIKYKKGSKSLCGMYPDDKFFYVLIVLGISELTKIEEEQKLFSKEFLDIVERSGTLNGYKWVMPVVNSKELVEDVKRVIKYKYPIK